MVVFSVEKFDDAHKFLDVLRLSGRGWSLFPNKLDLADTEWSRPWIFRGQSSSDWPLLPKAWRKQDTSQAVLHLNDVIASCKSQLASAAPPALDRQHFGINPSKLSPQERGEYRARLSDLIVQDYAEMQVVNQFTRLADELGFKVDSLPNWTKYIQYFPDRYLSNFFKKINIDARSEQTPPQFPEYHHRTDQRLFWGQPIFAIAQHHGIATRLLDWTRNPLTAAFFAASGVKDVSKDGQIAVFALHRSLLIGTDIHCIEIPSSSNDFLRAQSGVFTLDVGAPEHFLKHGEFPSHEKTLSDPSKQFSYYLGGDNPVPAKKLTLPYSQVKELLRLLFLERVTHAHLMPTLDHVAEAINALPGTDGYKYYGYIELF